MQTSAGDLKNIKYIIHASGPIWQNNFKEEDKNQFVDKIRSCIREALNLTKKMKDSARKQKDTEKLATLSKLLSL